MSKAAMPPNGECCMANVSALDSMSMMLSPICLPSRQACSADTVFCAICVAVWLKRVEVVLLSVFEREIGRVSFGFLLYVSSLSAGSLPLGGKRSSATLKLSSK